VRDGGIDLPGGKEHEAEQVMRVRKVRREAHHLFERGLSGGKIALLQGLHALFIKFLYRIRRGRLLLSEGQSDGKKYDRRDREPPCSEGKRNQDSGIPSDVLLKFRSSENLTMPLPREGVAR
jgi:hypothetical protein